MAHDVFICHSSKDRTIANAICSKLEQNRIRCWIAPRDVIPGTDYAQSIVEALSATKLTVLVFSDNSNQSRHVHREIERAVSHGVPILPFRVQEVAPSPALEYFISDAHWLDAITPPMEQHLEQLVGTVRLLLERINGKAETAVTTAAQGGSTATAVLPETATPPIGPAAPAAAPVPPRRSWWLWGAVAAVVVVAAVVAAVLVVGGGGKSGTTPQPAASSAPPASAAPTTTVGPAVSLGTTVNLAGMDAGSKTAVTALAVVDPATSADDTPAAGNRYVAVQFRIRNIGTRVYDDAPDNSASLVVAGGRTYEAVTVYSVAAGPLVPATVTMQPGKDVTGYTVFELPSSAKVVAIHFTMDSGYADQTANWSVG